MTLCLFFLYLKVSRCPLFKLPFLCPFTSLSGLLLFSSHLLSPGYMTLSRIPDVVIPYSPKGCSAVDGWVGFGILLRDIRVRPGTESPFVPRTRTLYGYPLDRT